MKLALPALVIAVGCRTGELPPSASDVTPAAHMALPRGSAPAPASRTEEIRLVSLQHAHAAEIASTMNELAEWLLTTASERSVAGCVYYEDGYLPPAPSLKFRVEPGSAADTVLVHAAPDIAERVARTIADLDRQSAR